MTEDIDLNYPSLLQLRTLKNFQKWACQKYDPTLPSLPLFYTDQLGKDYPITKPLKYLEAATHSSINQLYFIWMPIFLLTFTYNIPLLKPGFFVLGTGLWTFIEYILHRFVFHNKFCNRNIPEITFLLHYNHHKQPTDLSRLSTPLLLSLPISYLILLGLQSLLPWDSAISCGLGIALGYMAYDWIHYMTHARPLFLSIQQHHMGHHGLCEKKFGFTTRFWDALFKTEK